MTQLAEAPAGRYSDGVAAEVRSLAARNMVKQAQLAQLLGLPNSSISARWRGVTPWTTNELAAIAELLGVSIADLFPETRAARRRAADGPDVRPPGLEPGTQWLRASAGRVVSLAAYRARREAVSA